MPREIILAQLKDRVSVFDYGSLVPASQVKHSAELIMQLSGCTARQADMATIEDFAKDLFPEFKDSLKARTRMEHDLLPGFSLWRKPVERDGDLYRIAFTPSSGRLYGVRYDISREQLATLEEIHGEAYRLAITKTITGIDSVVFVKP